MTTINCIIETNIYRKYELVGPNSYATCVIEKYDKNWSKWMAC